MSLPSLSSHFPEPDIPSLTAAPQTAGNHKKKNLQSENLLYNHLGLWRTSCFDAVIAQSEYVFIRIKVRDKLLFTR